jgi:uncharacterized iron-regulated protein
MPKLIFYLSFLLLFIVPARAAQPSIQTTHYDLSVAFDVPASRLIGTAKLGIEAGATVTLDVADLLITGMTLNDVAVEHVLKDGKMAVTAPRQGVLAIRYEGVFKGDPSETGKDRTGNVIDTRDIVLTDGWYPKLDGLIQYRLRAVLPKGYEALSEAEKIERTSQENAAEFEFHFDHPAEGITLVASSRYRIVKDDLNGIELYAYFFHEDREQAGKYLSQVKTCLRSYERLIAPYPFKRLTIAEHVLSGSRSLPTMTLLDRDTVRLPVIPEPLLSREVLSQWFGNSVYVDRETGNWADGLIMYLSDHRRAEAERKDWKFRKQMLMEYGAFAGPDNEISLREYSYGRDRASRAVGYGKAAMVFHMLKRAAGGEIFSEAVKGFISANRYRKTSWDDIREAFEEKSGRDLAGFFEQWVDRKGLPELTASKQTVTRKGDLFEISFDLAQKGKPYEMELPVLISLAEGAGKELVKLDSERKNVSLSAEREPRALTLDNDYETARRLTAVETPPVIARLLRETKFLIALPVAGKEAYVRVAAALKEWGGEERESQGLANESIKQSSVAVLGRDNPLIARLFGAAEPVNAGFGITVKKNPWNEDNVIVLIDARSGPEAEAAMEELHDYAEFSRLGFNDGVIVSKQIDDAGRGIKMELRQPAAAIDLSALKTLNDVIGAAAGKKIAYIGEYHDKHAHHAVQLEMIRGLYEKNPKLAIGMEMFQRPFQKVVDDYISGSIGERDFLKGTEYFKRWVFDYNLYKPILDFARSRKIPVVALNQKKEIVEKVSKSGLDSLSDEERAAIPGQMDFSDDKYRERLKEVFEQHKGSGNKNFDFFYQAQVLWDETMAESVDEFLRKNQDFAMVVIAGGGHLAFGSGIPKRSFRRNGLPYSIVLNDAEVDKDAGDYLILTEELEGVTAPKLMAVLQATENRVSVLDLPEDSISKKAGVRAGDIILALDGEPVQSVEDVKLLLFYKQKGEAVTAKVLRKRFFLADKIMQFEVKL